MLPRSVIARIRGTAAENDGNRSRRDKSRQKSRNRRQIRQPVLGMAIYARKCKKIAVIAAAVVSVGVGAAGVVAAMMSLGTAVAAVAVIGVAADRMNVLAGCAPQKRHHETAPRETATVDIETDDRSAIQQEHECRHCRYEAFRLHCWSPFAGLTGSTGSIRRTTTCKCTDFCGKMYRPRRKISQVSGAGQR